MNKKRAKFVELAEKRVNRALKDLRLISNLANRSNYEYTDADVRKIIKVLQAEVNAVKARFVDNGSGAGSAFTLRDTRETEGD